MALRLFTNNAKSTLDSGITNVATSLTVASGEGALFPNPSGGDYFLATLDDGTNIEIVKVTARATDVFTIVRAQEGTSGTAFSAGDKVELRLTAGAIGDSLFDEATRMLFQQTAAPTGWTKVTTGVDNKSLRITTGTVGSGGATGFTSVFGSSKVTGAHTLAASEMPAHTHTTNRTLTTGGGGSGFATNAGIVTTGTGSTGGGGSHTHTLSLDLQYEDVIIATKD